MLHSYVSLKKPESWIGDIDFSNPAAVRVCVAQEFEGCATQLTALITDGETDPVGRPIYAPPVEHRWERLPGATLLGDAAHRMPFGQPAFLSMVDLPGSRHWRYRENSGKPLVDVWKRWTAWNAVSPSVIQTESLVHRMRL